MKKPKVSILMITYNHEPFIAQAIESVLMQRTNFDFELVIGEDCSTDKTREIVKKFYQQSPDKIRLLLAEENLGAQKNYVRTYHACHGEYIALLEGDDYWTSSQKLQTQVDFLENHSDFTVCFHWADILNQQTGDIFSKGWGPSTIKPYYTVDDLLMSTDFIPTCSVLSRHKLFGEFPAWYWESIMGDFIQHILNALYGKIGFLDEVMSVHRRHEGGICGGETPINNLYKALHVYALIGENLHLKERDSYSHGIANLKLEFFKVYRSQGKQLYALFALYEAWKIAPTYLKNEIAHIDSGFLSMLQHVQAFVQLLRTIRIYGLYLLKHCCGPKLYQMLKGMYRLLKPQRESHK